MSPPAAIRRRTDSTLRRRALRGARVPGAALTARFIGLGQSAISQVLEERVLLPPGTILTSRFEGARVDFTFTLPDANGESQARLERLREALDGCLAEHLYAFGERTLEEVARFGLRGADDAARLALETAVLDRLRRLLKRASSEASSER